MQINSKKIRIIQKWSLSKNYRELQIFLKFVNYYKRFIENYFKLFVFFIDFLKKNKNDKKFEFFQYFKKQKQTFRKFRDIFVSIFILHHYDFIKKIKIKFDIFNFVVVDIINQQNQFENWRSMTFWSRKIILAKQNYETHDQKLLIIIALFQQWKHYCENVAHSIEIWSNHNNLREFMKQKQFNFKQARWALKFVVYDFEIFYQTNKINFVNDFFKRSNYKKISK